MTATARVCPSCAAPAASGPFCEQCGASVGARVCHRCQAVLSSQAQFCHRCGTPVQEVRKPVSNERTPWIVAGTVVLLTVGAIIYQVTASRAAPVVPDMANNGAAAPGGRGGPAPDISQMTPRERFDRLFNRIMTAVESGDSTTVANFSPMALGAYAQLDQIDADARYHAALIHLSLRDFAAAGALADTIQQGTPGHLFGYLIRGAAAQGQNQAGALERTYRDFLSHYETEMSAGRPEYQEHAGVLDEFRRQAQNGSP